MRLKKSRFHAIRSWTSYTRPLMVVACVILTISCADSVGEIVSYKNAGDDAYARSDYTEAERQYRAALKRAKRSYPNDLITLICLRSLAQVLIAQDRTEEAEAIYVERIKLLTMSPKDPAYTATVYDDLATLHILNRRVSAAKPLYQQAIALTESAYGVGDPKVTEKVRYYVELLKGKDYEAEALELQERLPAAKSVVESKPSEK